MCAASFISDTDISILLIVAKLLPGHQTSRGKSKGTALHHLSTEQYQIVRENLYRKSGLYDILLMKLFCSYCIFGRIFSTKTTRGKGISDSNTVANISIVEENSF